MGRGVSLGEIVGWRIGASKKLKVTRILDEIKDYPLEQEDFGEKTSWTVNRSASHANIEKRSAQLQLLKSTKPENPNKDGALIQLKELP